MRAKVSVAILLSGFAASVPFWVGSGLPTGCQGQDGGGVPSAPAVVTRPEEWLDFSMVTPRPVAIRPDGGSVVVNAGCEAILYDLETGKRLHSWNEKFSSVSFSRDGRFLAAVQLDNVSVWDTETLVEVRRFTGRPPAWNEPNYRSSVTIAALNDDGSLVAIANDRDSFHRELPPGVLLYDTRSGQLLKTLATPQVTLIRSVEFLPGCQRLLVSYSSWREGERGTSVHLLWDTERGDLVREFPLAATVRFSRDGRWIATGIVAGRPFDSGGGARAESTSLSFWESETGTQVRTVENALPMRDFVFSPSGKRILAALERKRTSQTGRSFEGQLVEWDVPSGEIAFQSEDSPKPYARVAYSPDGRRRFAVTEWPNGLDDDVDHLLCGWNVETGARLPLADYPFASYNGYEDLFFFTKGDRFIDLAAPFEVREVLTGKSLLTLPDYRGEMSDVAFTPDGITFLAGAFIASGVAGKYHEHRLRGQHPVFVDGGRTLFSYDHANLYLSDATTGEIIGTIPLHGSYGRLDAAVSSDAKHILVSQQLNKDLPSATRLILIRTSQPFNPRILEQYASAISFHPDGTRFAAASPGTIDELAAESGVLIRSLWNPPGRPIDVVYSPDGNMLLACGVAGHSDRREPVNIKDQGWAEIWDAGASKIVPLMGHTAPATTAAFSPDGTRCVTGSLDKTIRLWDTATGRGLCIFRGHLGGIRRVDYCPRGDRILSAAEDGAAFWNVARFAAPPLESVPLAKSFTLVHSTEAIGLPRQESGRSAPAPREYDFTTGLASWPVIRVGAVDRRELSPETQLWLSQSSAMELYDAPPPSKTSPSPPSHYELRDTSRNGHRKVYVSARERKAAVCNEASEILHTWDGCSSSTQVLLAPSGKEVIIAPEMPSGDDPRHELTVYDTDSGASKRVLRMAAPFRSIAAVDPQERTVMIFTGQGQFALHDYQTGERISVLETPERGPAPRVEYSPDGRFMATCRFPELEVTLRDPATLVLVRTFSNLFPVRSFEFSPDEKRLLVRQGYSQECSLLTMWDIDSECRLWSRVAPVSESTVFSDDGRRFVSYGRGVHSELSTYWDAETGEILCAVLAADPSPANQPIMGADGLSLHLGSFEGPCLWPRN